MTIHSLFAVAWTALLFTLFQSEEKPGPSVFTWIGLTFSLNAYLSFLTTLSLVLVLYCGPLFQLAFLEDIESDCDTRAVKDFFVAPIYQEVVFRGVLVSALLGAGFAPSAAVLISAAVSATAPLADLGDMCLTKKEKVAQILGALAAECVFHGLVGAFTARIFVATGQLYGPITARCFLNFMGIPDIGFLTEPSHYAYKYKIWVSLVYLVGIIGFYFLFPLMIDETLFEPFHYTLGAK